MNVYDFPSLANGTAISYGIYDLMENSGFVNVGIGYDTSEFAVESIRQWGNIVNGENLDASLRHKGFQLDNVRGIGARRLTSRGLRCDRRLHRSETGACRKQNVSKGSVVSADASERMWASVGDSSRNRSNSSGNDIFPTLKFISVDLLASTIS